MLLHKKKTVTEDEVFYITEQEIVEILISECRKYLPEKMQRTPGQSDFDVYGESGTVRGVKISFKHESQFESPEEDKPLSSVMSLSVHELEFSVRVYSCLERSTIRTVGELVEKTEADLLKSKTFGRKSLKEIREVLAQMGLTLGMNKKQIEGRELLGRSLDELALSARIANCLEHQHIHTIEQLVAMTAKELLLLSGIGEQAFFEIRDKLSAVGLSLAQTLETGKER